MTTLLCLKNRVSLVRVLVVIDPPTLLCMFKIIPCVALTSQCVLFWIASYSLEVDLIENKNSFAQSLRKKQKFDKKESFDQNGSWFSK